MLGDRDDLNDIIELVRDIFFAPHTALSNAMNWDDDDFLGYVNDAVVRLANMFDSVEQAHRVAWGFTGAKKKQAVSRKN